MIQINNTQLLNLEEAVRRNKEDIARHWAVDRVLADFGIKVLGRLDSADQLPETADAYGDAYLVGLYEPYNVYIWSRANIDAGEPNDYWINIGPIAIVGPRGPVGPKGEKGDRGDSTAWYTGNNPTSGSYNPGDLWLNTTRGDIYKYSSGQWSFISNIKGPQGQQGPQGPQGLKGDKGDRGERGPEGQQAPAVKIIGKVTSIDQLPPASAEYIGLGYIVTDSTTSYLYVLKDNRNNTYQWIMGGILTGESIILANGAVQAEWNADTKLDKVTSTGSSDRAYVVNTAGNQTVTEISTIPTGNTIVKRDEAGRLQTETPVSAFDAVPLNYLNEEFMTRSDINDNLDTKLSVPEDGAQGNVLVWNFDTECTTIPMRTDAIANTLVKRDASGNFSVSPNALTINDALCFSSAASIFGGDRLVIFQANNNEKTYNPPTATNFGWTTADTSSGVLGYISSFAVTDTGTLTGIPAHMTLWNFTDTAQTAILINAIKVRNNDNPLSEVYVAAPNVITYALNQGVSGFRDLQINVPARSTITVDEKTGSRGSYTQHFIY